MNTIAFILLGAIITATVVVVIAALHATFIYIKEDM